MKKRVIKKPLQNRINYDPYAAQRQKVLESALQRAYLEDLKRQQNAELNELKKKIEEEKRKDKIERDLLKMAVQTSGILPPEGSIFLIDKEGKKALIGENEFRLKKKPDKKPSVVTELIENPETIEKLEKSEEIIKAKDKIISEKSEKSLEAQIKAIMDGQSYKAVNNNIFANLDDNEAAKAEVLEFFGIEVNKSNLERSLNTILNKAKKNDPFLFYELLEKINKIPPSSVNKISNPDTALRRLKGILGKGLSHSEDEDLLYDGEIDEYLSPLKKYGFLGVYMSDQIASKYVIRDNELQKRGSMIINTEPTKDSKGNENSGEHWVALYWDLRHKNEGDYNVHFVEGPHNQGIFYYDSYGRPPSDGLLIQIKKLMDRIRKKFGINYETFFTYNTDQEQHLDSSTCGWFAVAFLVDMYNGYDPTMDPPVKSNKEKKK